MFDDVARDCLRVAADVELWRERAVAAEQRCGELRAQVDGAQQRLSERLFADRFTGSVPGHDGEHDVGGEGGDEEERKASTLLGLERTLSLRLMNQNQALRQEVGNGWHPDAAPARLTRARCSHAVQHACALTALPSRALEGRRWRASRRSWRGTGDELLTPRLCGWRRHRQHGDRHSPTAALWSTSGS